MPLTETEVRGEDQALLRRWAKSPGWEEFKGLLQKGRHWFIDPLFKVDVHVVSRREPWLKHKDLDVIIKSGVLEDHAMVLDLKDRIYAG